MRRSKSKTITRDDLADTIHHEIGLSKPVSSQLVNSLISKIEDGLTTDGIVKLPGFGNFVTTLKSERTARNPKTGQPVMISPRRVVTFKPSTKLIERVDQALSQPSPRTEASSIRYKWRQGSHG